MITGVRHVEELFTLVDALTLDECVRLSKRVNERYAKLELDTIKKKLTNESWKIGDTIVWQHRTGIIEAMPRPGKRLVVVREFANNRMWRVNPLLATLVRRA